MPDKIKSRLKSPQHSAKGKNDDIDPYRPPIFSKLSECFFKIIGYNKPMQTDGRRNKASDEKAI